MLLAYPQAWCPAVSSKDKRSEEKLLTYDDLLEFVEEIELGDLEKYPPDEVKSVIQLLVFLAKNGITSYSSKARWRTF